jgi:hypothetical protein
VRVPSELKGQQVRCPACGIVFTGGTDILSALPADEPHVEGIQTARPMRPAPEPEGQYCERRLEQPVKSRRPWREDEGEDFRPLEFPRDLPGRGLATAAMVLLGLNLFADCGAMVVNAVKMQAAPVVKPKAAPGNDADDLAELFANPFECVAPLLGLPTAIVFLMWVYRVYSNLYLFRVSGLTYSPGWAVGYFFIPIINLFRPYMALQEVWRASDPDLPPDDRRGWRNTDSSAVILLWWLLWIAGGILAHVYLRMALSGRAEDAPSKQVDIISDALSVGAAVFAMLMIYQMRNRQTLKYQRVQDHQSDQAMEAGEAAP